MKKYLYLLVFSVAFGLMACNNQDNNSLIGKWKKDTITLTVNDNGTQRGEYKIPGDISNTQYDVTGVYTLSGDTFQFVNTAGLSSCPYGDTAVYTYSIHSNVLTLVLVSDQCNGRGLFFPGNYNRQ